MEEAIVIDIRNITKIYKGRHEPAVDNLDLQINKGEFYGLLGPNGAGKTTLISIISSLIEPSNGSIYIKGMELKNNLDKIKPLIGIVPQDIALYEKLTAYENLYYFGSLYGITKEKLNKRIDFLLDRLGLLKYKNDKIKSFSGGMKRRINLIAGVLHRPEILILDEPVVGVDVHSRNVIRTFLQDVNANNTTIIYTSHIMEDIEKLCNKISIIDYGKLIEKNISPKELVASYNDCETLEDVFLKLTGQKLRD